MEKTIREKGMGVLSHQESNEGCKELLRSLWAPNGCSEGHICLVIVKSRERNEPAASHQKGILAGKANDWAEIRNPGAGGGRRPMQLEGEGEGGGLGSARREQAAQVVKPSQGNWSWTLPAWCSPRKLQKSLRRERSSNCATVTKVLMPQGSCTNSIRCAHPPVILGLGWTLDPRGAWERS